MKPRPPRSPRRGGFSLLEIVAAAAVFLLVMTLLLQVVSGVSDAASHQSKRLEAAGAARRALDTLAQDIYVLVRQNGATILFRPGDATRNDALRFLCLSRPAPGTEKPRMSLVSYGVEARRDPASGEDVPMLVRGDAPVSWPTGNESVVAEYDFAAVLDRPIADGHVAAEGVFRFEILWLRKDGVTCRLPPEEEATDGDAAAGDFRRVDLARVSGFIVTVAGLDRQSQALAAEFDFPALQRTFSAGAETSAAVAENPLDAWTGQIARAMPPRLRGHIRFVQRTYYLP